MAWAAVTPKFDDWKNPFGGTYRGWQPEDLVDFYFSERRNWAHFKKTRDVPLTLRQTSAEGPYQPERIPQYHQLALREIFNVGSDFSFSASFTYVAGEVAKGVSCILRLKSPGHFITAVCYDNEKMLVGFKDPAPVRWLQQTEDRNGNKWMNATQFKENIHPDITRCWRNE